MTKLLVSVRSADEATAALSGGADWIDVKEPQQGALGAAEGSVWFDVAQALPADVPLSVAGGELAAVGSSPPALPQRVSVFKVGLANCHQRSWRAELAQFALRLPPACQLAAVIYADGHECGAPCPQDILDVALELRCGALLIDTYFKDGRGLFDHVESGELSRWLGMAKQNGLVTVLAGSLTESRFARAVEIGPDVVAVRSAACPRGRNSEVSETAVRDLAQALRRLTTLRPQQLPTS